MAVVSWGLIGGIAPGNLCHSNNTSIIRVTPITISELKEQVGETPVVAAVHAQLQSRATRKTKADKPYLELSLADSTGHFQLKIWSDSPIYKEAESIPESTVVRLEAKWTQNQYGFDAKELSFHQPGPKALDDFFAGDAAIRMKQDHDFADIVRFCESIDDPRLHALCQSFLRCSSVAYVHTRPHHALDLMSAGSDDFGNYFWQMV